VGLPPKAPGDACTAKGFVEPPTCMASAWGHYMDSSGTLLKADGYGAIRWRGQSISGAACREIIEGSPSGDLVWGPCEDLYAFQCAESFVSKVSGEQYQLHRVEVFSRLPDVRCEGLICVTRDDDVVTMTLTAGLQLQDMLYDPTRQHRTAIGLEISREAAEVPVGVFADGGAVRVCLGVFCRVGERGDRLLMQREPPSMAALAGRDVVRYLFPPEAMLLDPSDGPVPVTVEFVWSSSFKNEVGSRISAGSVVAHRPAPAPIGAMPLRGPGARCRRQPVPEEAPEHGDIPGSGNPADAFALPLSGLDVGDSLPLRGQIPPGSRARRILRALSPFWLSALPGVGGACGGCCGGVCFPR
jgi:hypothetical protein